MDNLFFINVNVRSSLRAPRLILRASSDPEVCETQTGDLWKANLEPDQLSYTPQN
jgi:hypothetical protein